MKYLKQSLPIIFLLSLCFLVIKPIFMTGFFHVHDDTQPTRIFEMAQSLKDGMFPVRWVKDLGFGYGYPLFNFYAPFPYYVGAFYHFVGFDILTATKMMYATPILLAATGMFLFMRSFLGLAPSFVATTIYIFFPYFAVNIFIRGAVGEYFAYSLLPYIFWGLFKLYYATKKSFDYQHRWVFLSAISIALLLISHNLSGYILGLILLLFLLIVFIAKKEYKILVVRFGFVFLFAFILSAFYTLPALFEMQYTDVASQTVGQSQFFYHFICPSQLWSSPWGYTGSVAGCNDGLSFRLGKSTIIFAVISFIAGIFFIYRKRQEKYTGLFSFATIITIFAIFMTFNISQFLWNILPHSNFLQFPWRFLNIVGLGLSLLIAFGIYFLEKYHKTIATVGSILIVVITVFLNGKLFAPESYNNRTVSYYTNIQNIHFAISDLTSEYLPQGFHRPKNLQEVPSQLITIASKSGSVKITENTTTTLHAIITMSKTGEVFINKAYFPAWELVIDGRKTQAQQTSTGMKVSLSKGDHGLLLHFTQTPIEKIANTISLTGVLLLLLAIIISTHKKKHGKKTT